MERLVQGGEAATPRLRVGTAIAMTLGLDEPPHDWPGAVAVHAEGRRVGWVNGGGEEMRRALREIAARGLYLAGMLGRLRWRRGDNGKPHSASGAMIRYPPRGRLLVSQVTEAGGRVVDFGGVVVRD